MHKKLASIHSLTQLICAVIISYLIGTTTLYAATHIQKPKKHSHIATFKQKAKLPLNSRKKKTYLVKKTHRQTLAHTSARIGQTDKINTQNVAQSNVPLYVLSNIEKRLVNFVRNTVSSLHYSNYKMGGTTIDSSRGIYVVDCSTYVDHILKTVYPSAFNSLVVGTGTEKPTTDDYYDYFINLGYKSQRHWNTVDDVDDLRPGDILVFRFKNAYGNETGGHVMVVMDQPAKDGDTFLVRVADSAPTGHSEDTRLPRRSGIGIGTLMLKVDSKTFQPYAYAWKEGARWQRNVNFAMARPINNA